MTRPDSRALPILVFLLIASGLRAQDERLPVPEKKAILAARKEVAREVAKLAGPAARIKALLDLGADAAADPVRRHAALDEAQALADEAEDLDAALGARRLQLDLFALDRLDGLHDFLVDFAKGKKSAGIAERTAEELVDLAALAFARRDPKRAGKLVDEAAALARKAKLTGLGRVLKEADALVTELGRIAARAEKGGADADPLDLVLLALARGDADLAQRLAATADEELVALAAAEEKAGTKAAETLDLAERWWLVAEKRPSKALQALFRARGLTLALGTVGRVNGELELRLAPWLVRSQHRLLADRLLLLDEDGRDFVADAAIEDLDARIAKLDLDRRRAGWRENLPIFPEMRFSSRHRYLAIMETSEGELVLELHPEAAPRHCANLIYLARIGFYDDLKVHRIVQGFMAQFGCPRGDGKGGPGYKFDGELATSLKHDRTGILSMANSGPGTDGCQFFVTFTATAHLDGLHTAFGRMLTGRKTCLALEQKGGSGDAGIPSETVTLKSIRIRVL
ncbi:MAG: peptidylprolyl isomerase [Planctomycetes bacterium]|nr:peptidylprolyl isomerase [Planctomycetota bacterium]